MFFVAVAYIGGILPMALVGQTAFAAFLAAGVLVSLPVRHWTWKRRFHVTWRQHLARRRRHGVPDPWHMLPLRVKWGELA